VKMKMSGYGWKNDEKKSRISFVNGGEFPHIPEPTCAMPTYQHLTHHCCRNEFLFAWR